MEKINNLKIYNSRMEAGMEDKLFFLPFLEKSPLLIDYGCADGTLAKHVKDIFPDSAIYGFDIDENMLELAKKRFHDERDVHMCPSYCFYALADLRTASLRAPFNLSKYSQYHQSHDEILNVSSVIHEVYSYGSEEEIEAFWKNVFGIGFDKIAIRDMCFVSDKEYPSQFKGFQEFYERFLEGIKKNNLETMWEQYSQHSSTPLSYKMIVHFLMKYHYVENWDREMRENYFSLTLEELRDKIPDTYEVRYEECYILPYIKEYVYNEFGIKLDCKTHIKMILEKK